MNMIRTIEEYRAALAAHDWSYEFSDDHRAYTRGHHERRDLECAAPKFDPDRALWNAAAPADYRVKVAA